MALIHAATILNDPEHLKGFSHTAHQFFAVAYAGSDFSRQMLDQLLSFDINQLRVVRQASPWRRLTVARVR